eukprot:gene21555-28548_t
MEAAGLAEPGGAGGAVVGGGGRSCASCGVVGEARRRARNAHSRWKHRATGARGTNPYPKPGPGGVTAVRIGFKGSCESIKRTPGSPERTAVAGNGYVLWAGRAGYQGQLPKGSMKLGPRAHSEPPLGESAPYMQGLMDAVTALDVASARASHATWSRGLCPKFVSWEELSGGVSPLQLPAARHPLLLQKVLPPLPRPPSTVLKKVHLGGESGQCQ